MCWWGCSVGLALLVMVKCETPVMMSCGNVTIAGSFASADCPGISDGTGCSTDGSDNYHSVALTFNLSSGKFEGSITTNLCSNDHYGFCALCDPPQYLSNKHTALCTEQRIPSVYGPSAAPLRGRVGLSVFGVNIYGPMEAGFGIGSNPKPCTDGSGVCPAGMDVPTCEDSLTVTCGSSSKVQHSLMLDSCGGHAMPYHYHNDNACDYDHTLPGHSPIIGFALDGRGIYGLYEDQPTKPKDLDACNGHMGEVPANSTYGVPEGSSVYHYHVTSWAPYTIGCYGVPEGVTQAQCKSLYNTSNGMTGKCNDEVYKVTTSDNATYCYDLDCPCFDGRTGKLGRNTDITDCSDMPTPSPTPSPGPPVLMWVVGVVSIVLISGTIGLCLFRRRAQAMPPLLGAP